MSSLSHPTAAATLSALPRRAVAPVADVQGRVFGVLAETARYEECRELRGHANAREQQLIRFVTAHGVALEVLTREGVHVSAHQVRTHTTQILRGIKALKAADAAEDAEAERGDRHVEAAGAEARVASGELEIWLDAWSPDRRGPLDGIDAQDSGSD